MMSRQNSEDGRSAMMVAADAAVLSAVSVFAAPLGVLIAPFAALYLHGKHPDRRWVACVAIGLAVAVASVAALFGIALAFGLLRPDGYQGGIAAIVSGGLALTVLFAIVSVDALRDLAVARRRHVALDVVRLISAFVMIAGTAIIVIIQRNNPVSEIGDAGAFSILSAVCSGVATLVASAIHSRWRKKAGPSNNGVNLTLAS